MRILIVPDIKGWAIDYLTQAIIKFNPHHKFECVYVPPRDAGEKEVQENFEKKIRDFNPDIIHFMYFRSASQLIENLSIIKGYKTIVSHHNQRTKALRGSDWNKLRVNKITCATQKAKEYLVNECKYPAKDVEVIPYCLDFNEFTYSDNEPEVKTVGYAGRIVPWKGLKDVAEVAHELKYKLMFMGRQDKVDYWNTIDLEARKNIDFNFNDCDDKDRLDYYRSLTCYVGFSKDGYEEGTLEYLEAMACGVPVITTPSGLAREYAIDNHNCLLVDFEDRVGLKVAVERLMNDKELRNKLRKNAWETVKAFTEEKFALSYSKLYSDMKEPDHQLVSVIIPVTLSRKKELKMMLKEMKKQTYPNFEIVIVFDEMVDKLDEYYILKEDIRKSFPDFTIKFDMTCRDGYNLAMARNIGAIEAEGEVLVFLDSRLAMEEMALFVFSQAIEKARDITMGGNKKTWFFGDKGGQKKSFVENFSAVSRSSFMKFGMFNERIDKYGGMSQEVRTRWVGQGGGFHYLDLAKAFELKKAKKDNKRRKDIIDMKLLLHKIYRGNNY